MSGVIYRQPPLQSTPPPFRSTYPSLANGPVTPKTSDIIAGQSVYRRPGLAQAGGRVGVAGGSNLRADAESLRVSRATVTHGTGPETYFGRPRSSFFASSAATVLGHGKDAVTRALQVTPGVQRTSQAQPPAPRTNRALQRPYPGSTLTHRSANQALASRKTNGATVGVNLSRAARELEEQSRLDSGTMLIKPRPQII